MPKKNSDAAGVQVPETEAGETETFQSPVPDEVPDPIAAELAQWKERCLRTAAEYDNYRKRTQREKELLWEEARADAVEKLLPVLDNLGLALAAPCSDGAFFSGLEMICRQTAEIFAKMDVVEIDAEGKPFDPNLMDAVMHVEDAALPENTVAEVFRKGYMMKERVLRHAVVKVAN